MRLVIVGVGDEHPHRAAGRTFARRRALLAGYRRGFLPARCGGPLQVAHLEGPVGSQHLTQRHLNRRPGDDQGAVRPLGCLLATTTPQIPPVRRLRTAAPFIPGLMVSEARSRNAVGAVPSGAAVGEPEGVGDFAAVWRGWLPEDLELVVWAWPLRVDADTRVAFESRYLQDRKVGIAGLQQRDRPSLAGQQQRRPGDRDLPGRLAVTFPADS